MSLAHAAGVAAIVGAVAAVLALGPVDQLWHEEPEPKRGDLVLLRPDVKNQPTEYYEVDDRIVARSETAPTIDLPLFNRGEATVVTTSLRVEINDFAEFRACVTGGGDGGPIEISKTHKVVLPVPPLPAERSISFELLHEIPPGRTDRPAIRFERPSASLSGWSLFAISLYLRNTQASDSEMALDQYVIAVPGASRDGSYFPEDLSIREYAGSSGLSLEQSWCYRQNLNSLERMLAHPGHRSPEVRDFANVRMPPGFRASLDNRPAARAAEILASSQFGSQDAAIFAAEQTDDASLIARVRKRVAHQYLRDAKASLPDSPHRAEYAARRSLLAHPSSEAQALLTELQRRRN